MVLAGVEEKLPEELRGIFIYTWNKSTEDKVDPILNSIESLKRIFSLINPQNAKNDIGTTLSKIT